MQRLGRHGAALEAFDEAIRLDPAYGTAICNRGLLLQAMHREEAAASFKRVLTLTPTTPADWHTRSLACFHLKAFAAGAAAAQTALERDPSNRWSVFADHGGSESEDGPRISDVECQKK